MYITYKRMIDYVDQSTNLRYSSKSVANANRYFLLLVLAEQLVKKFLSLPLESFVFTVNMVKMQI